MHEIQKNAEHHGIIVDGARLDIDKMMAQKDKAVDGLTKGIEGLFKKYKVGQPMPSDRRSGRPVVGVTAGCFHGGLLSKK